MKVVLEPIGMALVFSFVVVLAASDWLVTRHWSALIVGFAWLFWG